MGRSSINISPVASSVPFSNATNGFTADNTQAAIEEARNSPAVNFLSTSTLQNIASSTDTVVTGVSYSNATGGPIKLTATFNADINIPSGGVLSTSFYLNGTQVADSLRKISGDGGLGAGAFRATSITNSKVTVPNGQTLDVRCSVSSGSIGVTARSNCLIRCGDF